MQPHKIISFQNPEIRIDHYMSKHFIHLLSWKVFSSTQWLIDFCMQPQEISAKSTVLLQWKFADRPSYRCSMEAFVRSLQALLAQKARKPKSSMLCRVLHMVVWRPVKTWLVPHLDCMRDKQRGEWVTKSKFHPLLDLFSNYTLQWHQPWTQTTHWRQGSEFSCALWCHTSSSCQAAAGLWRKDQTCRPSPWTGGRRLAGCQLWAVSASAGVTTQLY